MTSGQIYATLPETPVIEHRLLVPPKVNGTVKSVAANGKYKLMDTIVTLELESGDEYILTLCQKWPIRTARPVKKGWHQPYL